MNAREAMIYCLSDPSSDRLTSEQEVTAEWWSKNSEAIQPSDSEVRILLVAADSTIEIVRGLPGNCERINIGHPSIEQVIRLSFALSKLEKKQRW